MPELPEVEVVRRGLEEYLCGRRIELVEICHPRSIRRHQGDESTFTAAIVGRQVDAVRRRGKYLWWVFGSDALVAHLGMSGQFRVGRLGDEHHPHTRVCFDLDDGKQVRFLDQRMFGGFEWVLGGAELPVAHIAPDPLDPVYDELTVISRLQSRRSTVKRALLDQGLVSGIGNIYADEALWRSRLHYDYPTDRLSRRKAGEVLGSAAQVMTEALRVGGTSFDSLYVNVNGESGYFARDLDVYGREGLPCRRCATPIRREPFMNRSSFRCPRCQRLPR